MDMGPALQEVVEVGGREQVVGKMHMSQRGCAWEESMGGGDLWEGRGGGKGGPLC